MNFERFFGKDKGKGKGRASRAKPLGKDEPKPRRPDDSATVAKSTVPRAAAANAPVSPVRPSEVSGSPSAATATVAMIEVANGPSPSMVPTPTYEEIAARAYDLWQEQGRAEGCEHGNWIEAERQLRAERTRMRG